MKEAWKKLQAKIQELFEKPKTPIYRIPRFISDDELLMRRGTQWYIGPRKLGPEEVTALRADAAAFHESFLWTVMRRDIHYLAYLQGTAKRHTEEDAVYAGAMYRDLEIIEAFITRCRQL